MAKNWSFDKLRSVAEISPTKRLWLTWKNLRFAQWDKLLRIRPLSVLSANRKNCSLCKRPISTGISLWKLLFRRIRPFKKLKFPTCGDMEPTSFVQHSDPLMSATTGDPSPLAEVDAVIPRAHKHERVLGYLSFELRQCQPVCLIIAANHKGD